MENEKTNNAEFQKDALEVHDELDNNSVEDDSIIEDDLKILALSDANRRLILWDSENDDKKVPEFIANSVIHRSQDLTGSADEYHNLASEFGRKGLNLFAKAVAETGAAKYKLNVDLLADIIHFGSQCQDWDDVKEAYNRLQTIEKKMWTWRAYTFTIDYLKDKMETIEEEDQQFGKVNIRDEIKGLIEEYKKQKDERAWVADAELYLKFGERDEAIDALKAGIENVKVAPQCCLKLSDMLLEDGEYEEVVEYSSKGIRGTAQDQPSASNGYLLYISALAKDALIHKEALESGIASRNKGYNNTYAVRDALTDYRIAKNLLDEPIYIKNIIQREIILKEKSGIRNLDDEERNNIQNFDDEERNNEELQKIIEHLLSNASDDNN